MGCGNISLTDTDDENVKEAVFKDCTDGELTINGNAVLKANKFNNIGEAIDVTYTFKDVNLKVTDEEFTLRGTMRDGRLKRKL